MHDGIAEDRAKLHRKRRRKEVTTVSETKIVLRVENVTMQFGGVVAVNNLSHGGQ